MQGYCWIAAGWLFLAAALEAGEGGTPFAVGPMEYDARTGLVTLQFPSEPDSYYVLYCGEEFAGIREPLWIGVGAYEPTTESIQITPDQISLRFFRMVRREISSQVDTDDDGMSDVFELSNDHFLDALDPSDAWALSEGSYFIQDRETFEFLAERDNFPGALDVREVKFLITGVDTNDPRLYLMNTTTYAFHYSFARESLGWTMSLSSFNAQTYFLNEGRKNLAGSLIAHDHYQVENGDEGIYTMEFWPSDPVPYPYVQIAYDLMSAAMPFMSGRLFYHAPGETQRTLYRLEENLYDNSNIAVVRTEELFENITYSALNPGETFGRLRVVEGPTSTSVRDIVVFKMLPNDLSHVSGILTETPQTPLSHINLRAKQNNTPNAYVKNASDHPELAPFFDQLVRLTIRSDGFDIEPATQEEVDDFLDNARPPEPQFPPRDLFRTQIEDLDALGFDDSIAFGAKAANVAELATFLPEGMVPDGFAVPFYFYDEFMKWNGFYQAAQVMMNEHAFRNDIAFREAALAAFRDRIEDDGQLPHWMRDALDVMHHSFPNGISLRCRSSTNNEDLLGFNGAGLYESYTHRPDEGHIEKSIKQVWASLWTFRAFEEREFYRIDHLTAAMGVLVHPNYQNELANGVGITKNIYDPSWRGYYVNVQLGEDLVTNPEEASIPEEFLVASLAGREEYEIQYVRFSNRVPLGEKLLTKDHILELAEVMEAIQRHFRAAYGIPAGNNTFAMDIEFKITAEGHLNVKQARPWID